MRHVLLRGGRVVDPASRSDRPAEVLLSGDQVTAVGPGLAAPDHGETVDVTGCVVGPGFIDLHSHTHTVAGQRLQALDGVTTVLDLEAGLLPVQAAYRQAAAEGRPLHFGFSASWAAARAHVLTGAVPDASFEMIAHALGDAEWQRNSTSRERAAWLALIERDLELGAIGIGVLQGYAPSSDPEEFLAVARLAARHDVAVFTHARELAEIDPATPIDGPTELVRAAELTGAAMHHCHVNATSRQHVDRVLRQLDKARRRGGRITTEAYPYGAGATAVGAAFLSPDRLELAGIVPSRILLLDTGERIQDATHLREVRAREPAAACVVEFLDEQVPEERELLLRGLVTEDTVVASDAVPVRFPDGMPDMREWPLPAGSTTHPRTAGTFAKTLRIMVRERAEWTWVEAFRRCSLLPAQLLEATAPDMARKGRLQVDADADIVVLEPDLISDQASYQSPVTTSIGIRHLLVGGHFVVRDGHLCESSYPGRPVRST